MSDKIEEIRARQEEARTRLARAARSYMPVSEYNGLSWQCQRDRATLLAEVERQRAEIEGLRADNERLRANLRECACACSSIRECESEWAKDNYCLHLNARKALEGKP